jgi:hypothetical protein
MKSDKRGNDMTPEEYAHGIIAKANAGFFNPEGYGLYNEIVKSISAAVQAERERTIEQCAREAHAVSIVGLKKTASEAEEKIRALK